MVVLSAIIAAIGLIRNDMAIMIGTIIDLTVHVDVTFAAIEARNPSRLVGSSPGPGILSGRGTGPESDPGQYYLYQQRRGKILLLLGGGVQSPEEWILSRHTAVSDGFSQVPVHTVA